MNKDEDTLEIIRDYLKQHGLKSTLECLEKEENYKNLGTDKKNKVNFN